MFSEIIELIKYSVEAFTSVRNKIESSGRYRHGWRALFDLYKNIDDITKVAISNFDSIASLDQLTEDEINNRFEVLSRSVKGFIHSFQHAYNAIGVYDEELQRRLEICLWMKSRWYREFASIYSSGRYDRHTKRLTKKFLSMSFDIKKWGEELGHIYDSSRGTEQKFISSVSVTVEIDLNSDAKLKSLLEEGRRNVQELRRLKGALRKYLIENCSLRELLDAG